MRRFLLLLSLLLGFVWVHTEHCHVPEANIVQATEQGTFDVPQERLPKNGRITEPITTSQVGQTRTQSVTAGHGYGSHRTPGRTAYACSTVPQTLKHLFDGRRLETAPFQSAASRLYYVIALRRLLL